MTKQRSYILYLEDIQTAMLRIQEYILEHDVDSFRADYKTKEVKARYPETPWMEMYRLRNRISHEYFGVDFQILWRIATDYLPQNLAQINEILRIEKARMSNNS